MELSSIFHPLKFDILRGMNPLRSKMILASFTVLRILVHRLIMRPWQVWSEVEESSVKKAYLLINFLIKAI